MKNSIKRAQCRAGSSFAERENFGPTAKKILLSLLALVMTAMTASADVIPTTYTLGLDTNEHGTVTFKVGDNTVTEAQEGATVTVTVTPDTGWSFGTISGIWKAAEATARHRTAGIDMLQDIELTPVSGQTNTWTFTMERANVEISVAYKKLLTHADITIEDIAAVTYTGVALTPDVTVKDGENELVKDQDYTVSFSNNTGGGTGIATFKGIGDNYAGETTADFTILQAKGSVTFTPWVYEKTYGDEDFTITPYVRGDGELKYRSENESVATVDANTGLVTIKAAGTVLIYATLSATVNYTRASDYYKLTINPKEVEYEDGDVAQDENGYTVILTEDADNPNPAPLPDDADLAGLTYSRTLTAPGSNEGDATIDDEPANLFTICLPFVPETGDAAKYYTLSSVDGETLNFSEVTTPVANTPYVIAVTGSVNFTESCDDLDVSSMTISTTTVDGYTFNGTFTGLTNAQAVGKYILQDGNKWGKVTTEKPSAFIPPFRAFVEGPANGARLLSIGFNGDGNTTGIKYIHTQDSNGSEQWYDLNGRRIKMPTKNGLYIHNGRKEILK